MRSGNLAVAPGSFAVSSKPGSDGVRIAHDATTTIRSQSTNDHASSGRAGQNNPHRGGEIRSENRFASKHVLATLKSRTTAEARIWVREIIVGQMGLWNLCLNFGALRTVTLGTCRTHRSSVVSSPFLLFSRSKSFATSTATSRSSSPPNPASTSSLGPRNIPYGNPPYASM